MIISSRKDLSVKQEGLPNLEGKEQPASRARGLTAEYCVAAFVLLRFLGLVSIFSRCIKTLRMVTLFHSLLLHLLFAFHQLFLRSAPKLHHFLWDGKHSQDEGKWININTTLFCKYRQGLSWTIKTDLRVLFNSYYSIGAYLSLLSSLSCVWVLHSKITTTSIVQTLSVSK